MIRPRLRNASRNCADTNFAASLPFAITVVTPPGYVHSQAFYEVAETLHQGLHSLGHDPILTCDVRVPGRRHIILGANLLPVVNTQPAPDAILYNLEQIYPGSPWLSPDYLALFNASQKSAG
mgnify:CR=1 FL=1